MKFLLLLITFCASNLAFGQKCFVFFGSFNHDRNENGLYVYELDIETGTLEFKSSLSGIHNPSFITLSPDGKFLYACTESKTPNAGSVSSFAFNAEEAKLSFVNTQPSGGENPVYLTTDNSGKWLVNANYTEASISVYPLSDDGYIEPAVQNFHYEEGGINPVRQERAHIHAAVFSPDGKYIYVPDLGADKIRSYAFNTAQKKPLTEKQSIDTSPGSGPRHFTFHPNGKFAYSIEELSGMVSAYSYSDGILSEIQPIAAHPDTITVGYESSDVHILPDGKFLYATNRGKENNIAIFSINEDGSLTTVGYQSTLGLHPRTFAIDPTGNYLIVTNVNSSSAVVFKRNQLTGLLEKTDEVEIRNVSCVKIRNY